MNEKIYISRKYNKLLNILLGIYVTLCLVLSLLYNGFFINSKAFSNHDSWEVSGTCINNAGYGTNNRVARLTSNGNTKAIYYTDRDFIDLLNKKISALNQSELTATCVMIKARDKDLGGSITTEIISSVGGSIPALRGATLFIDRGTDLYNYFVNSGYELSPISNRSYEVTFYFNGTIDSDIYSAEFASSVPYVDNPKDLYKYLVQGDDSVVKNDNPDNPTLPEDNSLPVPQSLTCDLKNNDEGAPRFIAGSWKNPSSLLASYDANEVEIEIQYKPKLQFYKKLFDLKLGVGTSPSWIDVTKKKISEIDNWVSYMNLSENNPSSSGKSFHKNGKEDIETIATSNDYDNISSHVELLNGSSWRCRYVVNKKTSLWVVYGIDSINQFGRPSNSGDNITFQNASGDSISSSEVKYDNSNMTDKSYDNLSFLGKIRYDLDNLFSSLKSFFTPLDNNNGFYAFFGRVFEQFPIFWTLFILGLVVAILLRIFGR